MSDSITQDTSKAAHGINAQRVQMHYASCAPLPVRIDGSTKLVLDIPSHSVNILAAYGKAWNWPTNLGGRRFTLLKTLIDVSSELALTLRNNTVYGSSYHRLLDALWNPLTNGHTLAVIPATESAILSIRDVLTELPAKTPLIATIFMQEEQFRCPSDVELLVILPIFFVPTGGISATYSQSSLAIKLERALYHKLQFAYESTGAIDTAIVYAMPANCCYLPLTLRENAHIAAAFCQQLELHFKEKEKADGSSTSET